jgi:DMSO/TMAO reductase YedYZ molybdopterin-dependent catalytic subunit
MPAKTTEERAGQTALVPDRGRPRVRSGRAPGALRGLVAAGVAIGVAQLVAGLVDPQTSPILTVGQAAIDLTPEWLKSFAIAAFGPADKLVLLLGMLVVLALLAAFAGRAAIRRRSVGVVALLVLGGVGILAALTRPSATLAWAIPSIAATLAGLWALGFLLGRLVREEPATVEPDTAPYALDRRAFVRGALTIAGVSAATLVAGTAVANRRFGAGASRTAVRIPPPVDTAPPVPAGASLRVPGITPFVTANDSFYRVDTALLVPQLRAEDWRLKIHGMVDHELELDFEGLVARELVERDVTLSCVSNEVGGHYAGNARWTGVLLGPLLEEVGLDPGANQLVSRSIDGMTIGTPAAAVTDGRDAMLAVEMNGEPLPISHGFPVRMIVPGLYGYVSATKWIVDLEATTFDAFDAYWVERGWEQAPEGVKTMSRIDTPKPLADLDAGTVAVAGVAWAQHRGIERVEVRVDQGAWAEADLGDVPSDDTWRQWVWRWDATPGRHTLEVRATDGDGATQPEERTRPFPSGATGWHSVVVNVG